MFNSLCHKHSFRTIRKLQLSVRWFHFDLKISFCTFFYSCKKQSRPHHPVCSCRANLVQSCQMFDPGGKATDETDIQKCNDRAKKKRQQQLCILKAKNPVGYLEFSPHNTIFFWGQPLWPSWCWLSYLLLFGKNAPGGRCANQGCYQKWHWHNLW